MTISLLDRRVYGLPDVDRLLAPPPGTARRWIDGYDRGGVHYPTGHKMLVVRSGQTMMSAPVKSFVGDLRYAGDTDHEADAVVPVRFGGLVTLDPLHQYGRPGGQEPRPRQDHGKKLLKQHVARPGR